MLESIPRVGYRVKEIRWDEVEEICEIRKVNEVLAAQWAMRRITPKDFHFLEQNLFAAEAKAKAGHPESFVDFYSEFHEILARACASECLP